VCVSALDDAGLRSRPDLVPLRMVVEAWPKTIGRCGREGNFKSFWIAAFRFGIQMSRLPRPG
jgi:hypothetical protein